MKYLISIIALLYLLVLSSCTNVTTSNQEENNIDNSMNTETNLNNITTFSTEVMEKNDDSKRSKFYAEFPVLEWAIKDEIKSYIDEEFNEYTDVKDKQNSNYEEFIDAWNDESRSFSTIYNYSFEVLWKTNQMTFIWFNVSKTTLWWTRNEIKIFSFNEETNEIYNISDIIKENKNNDLSLLVQDKLKSQISWIMNTEFLTIKDFTNYYFTENGDLVIKFDQYKIASWAEWIITITLKYDDVRDFINSDILIKK